jgi:hypothetical protein
MGGTLPGEPSPAPSLGTARLQAALRRAVAPGGGARELQRWRVGAAREAAGELAREPGSGQAREQRRLGSAQVRGSAGVRAARAGAGKRAREVWWRAGDRLAALGSAQVARSAGRHWNRRSGAGSPCSRQCTRLQAAAQMWASSNGA